MRSTFERIRFQGNDGYMVCSFRTKEQIPAAAQTGKRTARGNPFTATGEHLPTSELLEYELHGEWTESKYGLQFQVQSYEELAPQTLDGITAYLNSGIIQGIGPKTAAAIVRRFGLQTLDILERFPDRLFEVPGISEKKLAAITESYQKTRAFRKLAAYLAPFGIRPGKVLEHLGPAAARLIETNPYHLCEVPGIGFQAAELVARQKGFSPSDPLRLSGALVYALQEASDAGHLYLPRRLLLEKTRRLLGGAPDTDSLERALNRLLSENGLQRDTENIFLPCNRKDEHDIAKQTVRMLRDSEPWMDGIPAEIAAAQGRLQTQLGEQQAKGVERFFSNTLSILTGGPGTGKTTTLRVILDILAHKFPRAEVILTAPTGIACRRMADATGCEAATLCSTLGLMYDDADGNLVQEDAGPLIADVVIVDEMSMVDNRIAAELFRRLAGGTRVLLVGDPDQLPSIGPGSVLRELLRSRLIPVTRLEQVYRQSSGSRIAVNADAINRGDWEKIQYGEDYQFIPAATSEAAAQAILQLYTAEVREHGVDNVQILSPFRKKGTVCSDSLNQLARSRMNPASSGKTELKHGDRIFRVGDKVLQTENHGQTVCNGDIGRISGIGRDSEGHPALTVRFPGERLVEYSGQQIGELTHAYAVSVHKSQGSEWPVVAVACLMEHKRMLTRNLIYTAVSRAKTKLILVGQREAFELAVKTVETGRRFTLLADRIVAYSCKQRAKISA